MPIVRVFSSMQTRANVERSIPLRAAAASKAAFCSSVTRTRTKFSLRSVFFFGGVIGSGERYPAPVVKTQFG